MKPPLFDYVRATSLDNALAHLAAADAETRVLAGGQSLIPAMNLRLVRPEVLIDIAGLAELRGIRRDNGTLVIGALTTHTDIVSDTEIAEAYPILAQIAGHIGHAAIRNRGTLGGSLANADPASEWPCAMLALDARIGVIGSSGRREFPADEFFITFYTTALGPDEIITDISIPVPSGEGLHSFHETAQQQGAFAMAMAMAVADPATAVVRLAIGGCSGRASLTVSAANEGTEELVERAVAELDPPSDAAATSGDRLQMARILAHRAIGDVSAAVPRRNNQ
ncbi:MAG: FAD binding domain-containing protein [Paracoccaceae bacterium]|nr:FAD binding domain-containing protein [Paracoccaceae bacterium]